MKNCLNLEDNAKNSQKWAPLNIAAVASVSVKKESKLNFEINKKRDDKGKNIAKETTGKK